MADGKIYITISDTRGGSGAGLSNDTDGGSNQKENAVGKFIQHKFFNLIESQAKQFVSYSINNIGNFTGDYQAQREVQGAMQIASIIMNIGTSAIAGAKMGGWVGAVVAASVATINEGFNIGYKEYTESFQNRKINRNIDMMRNRLGLEGLINGSRTGGY